MQQEYPWTETSQPPLSYVLKQIPEKFLTPWERKYLGLPAKN